METNCEEPLPLIDTVQARDSVTGGPVNQPSFTLRGNLNQETSVNETQIDLLQVEVELDSPALHKIHQERRIQPKTNTKHLAQELQEFLELQDAGMQEHINLHPPSQGVNSQASPSTELVNKTTHGLCAMQQNAVPFETQRTKSLEVMQLQPSQIKPLDAPDLSNNALIDLFSEDLPRSSIRKLKTKNMMCHLTKLSTNGCVCSESHETLNQIVEVD